jgi:hypothetical protein
MISREDMDKLMTLMLSGSRENILLAASIVKNESKETIICFLEEFFVRTTMQAMQLVDVRNLLVEGSGQFGYQANTNLCSVSLFYDNTVEKGIVGDKLHYYEVGWSSPFLGTDADIMIYTKQGVDNSMRVTVREYVYDGELHFDMFCDKQRLEYLFNYGSGMKVYGQESYVSLSLENRKVFHYAIDYILGVKTVIP